MNKYLTNTDSLVNLFLILLLHTVYFSFSYLINFAKDVGSRNPTMSKKQQLIRADEILLKSSEKVTGNKNLTLFKEIKALEREAGLLTKSPMDQRHTALKDNVFGKKSITEMTDDEFEKAKELDRLEKHPEKDKIKKVQQLIRKQIKELWLKK